MATDRDCEDYVRRLLHLHKSKPENAPVDVTIGVLRRLYSDLEGHKKALALQLAGMESACEKMDRLKQQVRELEVTATGSSPPQWYDRPPVSGHYAARARIMASAQPLTVLYVPDIAADDRSDLRYYGPIPDDPEAKRVETS